MLTIDNPVLVNEPGGLETIDAARVRFEVANDFPAGSRVDDVNLKFTYPDGFTGPADLDLGQPILAGETVAPDIRVETRVETPGSYEIKVDATFVLTVSDVGTGEGRLPLTVVGDG